MIVKEEFKTRSDGVKLVRTYSDGGYLIERDGVRYSEAIDPEEMGRVYTETDELIESDMSVLEQKAAAYDVLMGVSE